MFLSLWDVIFDEKTESWTGHNIKKKSIVLYIPIFTKVLTAKAFFIFFSTKNLQK